MTPAQLRFPVGARSRAMLSNGLPLSPTLSPGVAGGEGAKLP
jgi:hypothetical protein